MTDKKGREGSIFRQLLRHPIALVVLLAQLVFMLTCTYVSGVRKSEADPAKKVAVLVSRHAMLEMPFKTAERAYYHALSLDPKGVVIANQKITYGETPLDVLRGRIRLAAVLPFSLPAPW